jgi:hypothetical protein
MNDYSQGICEDGAAILKDGLPMTIEQILTELRSAQQPSAVVPSGVWQFYFDGEWTTGMNTNDHRANTKAAGFLIRDLWLKKDPTQ